LKTITTTKDVANTGATKDEIIKSKNGIISISIFSTPKLKLKTKIQYQKVLQFH